MASYVSWGTRKALGRRYSTDPALQLAQDRLEQEYALVPGREARALQESQFARNQAFNAEQAELNRAANKQAGIVGTVGNIGTTALLLNYLKPTAPAVSQGLQAWNPFVNTGRITNTLIPTAIPPPAVTPSATGIGTETAVGAGALGGYTAAELAAAREAGSAMGAAGNAWLTGKAVSPALIDASLTAEGGAPAAEAATGGMSAVEAGTKATGPAGPALGLQAGASAIGGYLGSKIGPKIGEQVGFGGEREWSAAGEIGGATAAGFGIGGPVGASIGFVIGGVSALTKGTWLCTAINKYVGTSKEQKAAMKKLRRYSKNNHPAWLNAYFVDGPLLIEGIEKAEGDLQAFYSALRDTLVVPVFKLVTEGQMEAAFDLYRQITIGLCKKYAPQINTEVV